MSAQFYVSCKEYSNLEFELKYEPKVALVACDGGLFFYKEIASKACRYLNDDGFILCELNANKANKIKQIFSMSGYKKAEIINDYAGLPRVLKVRKAFM